MLSADFIIKHYDTKHCIECLTNSWSHSRLSMRQAMQPANRSYHRTRRRHPSTPELAATSCPRPPLPRPPPMIKCCHVRQTQSTVAVISRDGRLAWQPFRADGRARISPLARSLGHLISIQNFSNATEGVLPLEGGSDLQFFNVTLAELSELM